MNLSALVLWETFNRIGAIARNPQYDFLKNRLASASAETYSRGDSVPPILAAVRNQLDSDKEKARKVLQTAGELELLLQEIEKQWLKIEII